MDFWLDPVGLTDVLSGNKLLCGNVGVGLIKESDFSSGMRPLSFMNTQPSTFVASLK